MAVAFQKTIPILRIFSVEKAKEFYVGFLGFTVDWEHHFEDNTPAYIQVSVVAISLANCDRATSNMNTSIGQARSPLNEPGSPPYGAFAEDTQGYEP
jgi:hypothetical protein